MTFSRQHIVYAYFNKLLIGRLFLKNHHIFFEYDPGFLKTKLELSPFKLPLKVGIITTQDRAFDGLFGVFNDSLPDGWGRLLLDRKLMSLGVSPEILSPLDRLCFVGSHGMGALTYQPENPQAMQSIINRDLDEIDYEIQTFVRDENDHYVDDLLALGGSSAGARPKILLTIDNQEWLIKFRSSMDTLDCGPLEYAYHLMGLEAGLDLPEAKLFPSRQAKGFFGVQRFDRRAGQHIHMHTIAGLLHADHRIPSLNYETIMKATIFLTRDAEQCEKQFRHAVFNVLSHNRDDHSKNFSFLMDEDGKWRVSPAYDLTFSFGPLGEHATLVMGEGKKPRLDHLLRLAAVAQIDKVKALEIIDQVHRATSHWTLHAEKAGVSKSQTKRIKDILKSVKEVF